MRMILDYFSKNIFVLIFIVITLLGRSVAHVTAASLLWTVQNYELIW